jgi:DNA-binding MarR family transcriptional regulator
VSVESQVLTAELIERLLYRRDVAIARQRATLARSLGLTDVEMLALVHVREQRALAPAQIARLLDLSSGGATALVQRLERAGHVVRTPHPTDRRSTLIRLSDQTAGRLAEAQAGFTAGLERTIAPLAETERVTVARFFFDLTALTEEIGAVARSRPEPATDAAARPVPSLWA